MTQLSAAFGCRVRWIETAPHTSLTVLEPAITDDVAVVLLLIRWSSHVYGELVHVCKARGRAAGQVGRRVQPEPGRA